MSCPCRADPAGDLRSAASPRSTRSRRESLRDGRKFCASARIADYCCATPGCRRRRTSNGCVNAFCGTDRGRTARARRSGRIIRILRTYDRIDLALDTFPYNGGTTTSEALWQGVPVVAIARRPLGIRVSASLLTNARLGEFIAQDATGYVDLAASFANDPARRDRLARLRRSLREQLRRFERLRCRRIRSPDGRSVFSDHPRRGGLAVEPWDGSPA